MMMMLLSREMVRNAHSYSINLIPFLSIFRLLMGIREKLGCIPHIPSRICAATLGRLRYGSTLFNNEGFGATSVIFSWIHLIRGLNITTPYCFFGSL